jgi:UPF0716 protein FxsA
MLALLAVVFIVMPLVELYVLIQVGHAIGLLNAIGLLLLVSLVGAWLARHEGFVVIRRVRERLDRGEVPRRELIDGHLVLAGGLLLTVPGFVTDALGILLLFPPIRALVRIWLARRFVVMTASGPRGPRGPNDPDGYDDGPGIIDV